MSGKPEVEPCKPYVPFRWVYTEPFMCFRKINTEPSMHFRKDNTAQSMHFRRDNTELLSVCQPSEPFTGHGICHGCTEIVCVKFYLPGLKLSSDHKLFVVNTLVVVVLNTF